MTHRIFLSSLGLLALWTWKCHAGGPLAVQNGKPLVWDTSQPIKYRVDDGDFRTADKELPSGLPGDPARDAIHDAFEVWSKVPTARVKFVFDGNLPDVKTAREFENLRKQSTDNFVILDQEAQIVNGLFGERNGKFVLGFATPLQARGHLVGFISVMNGRLATSIDQFRPTFVHEFGHAIGLDHSQIQPDLANNSVVEDDNCVPIMFPTSTDSEDLDPPAKRDLHPDDVAWISRLYPASGFGASFGVIRGTLTRKDNGRPILGAVVVAIDESDQSRRRFSCVSDYLKAGTGAFEIPVRPGKYKIFIEAVRPKFFEGSSVGPYARSATDESFSTKVRQDLFTNVIQVAAGNHQDAGELKAEILP